MTEKKGSVVSSESRWRRGCATDGQELIDNSEAKADKVTGKLGCTNVGQSSYDNIIVVSYLIYNTKRGLMILFRTETYAMPLQHHSMQHTQECYGWGGCF